MANPNTNTNTSDSYVPVPGGGVYSGPSSPLQQQTIPTDSAGTPTTTSVNNTATGFTETTTPKTPNVQSSIAQVARTPTPPVASAPTTTTTPTPPQTTSKDTDWRVKLTLAPGSSYLYNDPNIMPTDILYPLGPSGTGGVIFPYLPQISLSYRANYDGVDITHTNYKNYFYKNSAVEDINITAEFTAQDVSEARYMLAVIHFFKTVTKMFYGQDSSPVGGTPPPLCYITGLGAYQFNHHPIAITNFSYSLPNDVDYIRTENLLNQYSATSIPSLKATPAAATGKPNIFSGIANSINSFMSNHRLGSAGLNKGGTPGAPKFTNIASAIDQVSYVPTKLQIQLTAVPIVSRKDVSTTFKLNGAKSYSSGDLLKGGFW
jgi:hypothetical protein